jgi:hypothetical protein
MDRRNKRLTWLDVDWLGEAVRLVRGSRGTAPAAHRHEAHTGRSELLGTALAGVTANMGAIEDKTIGEGRFILPHERLRPRHQRHRCIGMDVPRTQVLPERPQARRPTRASSIPRPIDFLGRGRGAPRRPPQAPCSGSPLDNQMLHSRSKLPAYHAARTAPARQSPLQPASPPALRAHRRATPASRTTTLDDRRASRRSASSHKAEGSQRGTTVDIGLVNVRHDVQT